MLSRAAVRSLSLILLSAITSISASSNVAIPSTRFEILYPDELVKQNGYNHTIAQFGSYPKDVSISSPLFILRDSLCSPIPGGLQHASRVRGYPDKIEPSNYFVMASRGSCTFEQKARNAALMGAAGLVVASNVCTCGDAGCPQTANNNCEEFLPIMAGKGQVPIPVFLIKKSDADSLTAYASSHDDWLFSRMTFSVPDFQSVLEYEIVTNLANPSSEAFLASFGPTASSLAPFAKFKPAYQFWTAHCVGSCDPEACTNMGRYCGTYNNADAAIVGRPKGKDIVREILRRGCIWKEYGKDGYGKEWWDYIKAQDSSCDGSFQDEACIQNAMVTAGVDTSKIESCMLYSGGLENNNDNTVLQELLPDSYARAPQVNVGGFVLGNRPMQDSFTEENVRRAICDGFVEGYEPSACLPGQEPKQEKESINYPTAQEPNQEEKPSDDSPAVQQSQQYRNEKASSRHGAFWFSLLFVLSLSNCASYWIAKKVSRQEVMQALDSGQEDVLDDRHNDGEVPPDKETQSFV